MNKEDQMIKAGKKNSTLLLIRLEYKIEHPTESCRLTSANITVISKQKNNTSMHKEHKAG